MIYLALAVVVAFSSSASLLTINSEVTSNPVNLASEPGVTPISNTSQISQDGAWYKINLASMHAENFWEEFKTHILNLLTPGRLYGVLLQPRNWSHRVTGRHSL